MQTGPTLLQSWLKNHATYKAQGRKLAMVVGPGGNSGVIAGGALAAMYATGSFLPNTHYIGISVGAFAWMYTLVAEDYLGCTIFGRFLATRRYFHIGRLLQNRPALNLNYVVDHVLNHDVPMPYPTALASPLTIQAVTTCPNGKVALLPLTGASQAQVEEALKATAAMPMLGRTSNLTDLSNWDGWLVEPQLLAHLKSIGITDVIWFPNYVPSSLDELPMGARVIWKHILRKLNRISPALATLTRNRLYAGNFLATVPDGMNLEVMTPAATVSPISRNPQHIFHALGTSYRTMAAYLGHPNLPYPTEWAPWQHHMPKPPNS